MRAAVHRGARFSRSRPRSCQFEGRPYGRLVLFSELRRRLPFTVSACSANAAGGFALAPIVPGPAAFTPFDGGPPGILLIVLAVVLGFTLSLFVRFRPRQTANEPDLESFAAPALLIDKDGCLLNANNAARRLAESLGHAPSALVPGEATRWVARGAAAESAPEFSLGTHTFRVLLERTAHPSRFRLHLVDVTGDRRQREELIRARDEALRANELVNEFVANLSHDIRVPMNGVLGLGRLLLESALDAQQRELAQTLVESASNVVALADELLDLAKIEAGKLEIVPQSVELAPLVEETLRSQGARAAEKHLDLAADLAFDLPGLVEIDPIRTRQILANLLSNALKFTERGEVILRVWTETAARGRTELRFAVRDTGIGIPPEKRDRIFRAFSQADNATYRLQGGTGLGLFISRQLAELMGGRLWFDSEPGRGSTFTLAVPLFEVPGSVPPGWIAPQSALAGCHTILVEDNPRLLALYSTWLERWGCRVSAFRLASEALAWLESGATVDAALLDFDLPDGSAWPVLAALRPAGGTAPNKCVGFTAQPLAHKHAALATAWPVELLLKPITLTGLLSALQRAPLATAPAQRASRQHRATRRTPPAPAPLAGLRVLLADDDAVNRRVARTYLERLGCTVHAVTDGREVLDLFEREPDPCDVLLLDVMMPQLDGHSTARALRQRESAVQPPPPRLPIVAITAKAMSGDREACLAAGMDDYLTKPFTEVQLRTVLERYRPTPAPTPATGAASDPPPGAPLGGGTPPAIDPASPANKSPVDPEIDRARLDELASGDAEALREILVLYFEKIDELLAQIENARVASDRDTLKLLAHRAAGSSATCGMRAAQRAFRALEASAETAEVATIARQLTIVRRLVDAARPSVASPSRP
jgi:two-component system sensor histidine kinase/response regulator